VLLTKTLSAKISDVGIAKAMQSGEGIALTQARPPPLCAGARARRGRRGALQARRRSPVLRATCMAARGLAVRRLGGAFAADGRSGARPRRRRSAAWRPPLVSGEARAAQRWRGTAVGWAAWAARCRRGLTEVERLTLLVCAPAGARVVGVHGAGCGPRPLPGRGVCRMLAAHPCCLPPIPSLLKACVLRGPRAWLVTVRACGSRAAHPGL